MWVLKKNTQVHDGVTYPAGGPLATLPGGSALTAIRADVLSQLHVDHFMEVEADDPHPELVAERYAALSTAGRTDGFHGNRDGDLPSEDQE